VAERELRTRFTGDTSSLERATGTAKREMGGMDKAWKTGAASMAKTSAIAAAALGALAAADWAVGSISAASDLAESMSKVSTVFGTAAPEMERFIEAANGLNLSDQQAAALAGSMGNLAGQLGLTDKAGADLAKGVIGLGADLGSFHNLDTADVVERIQKAMTGELDGVKQLAPALNAAAVEQQALADTGKKNASDLTAQDKALATYALLVEQSSDAIGDLDRTSDSAANKQKNLSSQMADMQTELGEKLLPAWSGFLSFLLDTALPGLQRLADWFAREVPPWYAQHVRPVVDAIALKMAELFTFIRETAIPALAELAAWFATEVPKWYAEHVKPAMDMIVAAIGDAIDLIVWLWETFGETLLAFLGEMWGNIQALIDGALKVIQGIIDVALGILSGNWSQVWNGLKGIVSGVFRSLQGIVGTAIDLLGVPIAALGDVLAAPWEALTGVVEGVLRQISNLWNSTIGALSFSVPSWVPGIGGKGFDVPDIELGGRSARAAPLAAVVNMPVGTSGYEVLSKLRHVTRAGAGTDYRAVAVV
jgi:hypothetical protein